MRFHVCNIEPDGFRFGHFLDDTIRMFVYALESLGHVCTIGRNHLEPTCFNIVFGGHTLGLPEHVEQIAGACKYIAIQHEILNGNQVNLSQNEQHYRQVYLPFLQRAEMVWESVPRNGLALQQLGIRHAMFRAGYHPRLEEVALKRDRDIDFLFYGSITPHRQMMFDCLRARGHGVLSVFDTRAIYRNDLISRTKVHLAPIQGPSMKHFAAGRIVYLVNNRSLVVVERCEDQEWLEHSFISAPTEHWVDICEQTLERTDREAVAEEFAARFRHMPFTDQLQRVLDETFAAAGALPIAPSVSCTGSSAASQTTV